MKDLRKRLSEMQQFQPLPLKNKLYAGGMTACMGKRPRSDDYEGWVRLSKVLSLVDAATITEAKPSQEVGRG